MPATTLLSLTGAGFALSDYAVRGMTVELTQITQSAQVLRDINGNALDLSVAQMRKYRVTVTCRDQESPAFAEGGIWTGALVTATLIPQLGADDAIEIDCIVVEPWTESREEYEAESSWQLVLEEV